MSARVLVTGGAGFIGSRLVLALLRSGASVRVLDCLHPQVHRGAPSAIVDHPDVDMIVGDVCDRDIVRLALKGVDKVVHLAAEVGVGQSMYQVERYVRCNDVGSAVLMEAASKSNVERIVCASSMSVYGEGLYRDRAGRVVQIVERPLREAGGGWDPVDDEGQPLAPAPTPEWKQPALASVYALTKYVQERLTLTLAKAYAIEAVALRFFNVYGPGQALSNPYTGVLANFATRLLNGRSPLVFEDGEQLRDFVHVDDAVDAIERGLTAPIAGGDGVYNIASGAPRSVADVARALAEVMGRPDLEPEILGKARSGDVRHCIADVEKARTELGFSAKRDFSTALVELADWVTAQTAEDLVGVARRELESRGLVG